VRRIRELRDARPPWGILEPKVRRLPQSVEEMYEYFVQHARESSKLLLAFIRLLEPQGGLGIKAASHYLAFAETHRRAESDDLHSLADLVNRFGPLIAIAPTGDAESSHYIGAAHGLSWTALCAWSNHSMCSVQSLVDSDIRKYLHLPVELRELCAFVSKHMESSGPARRDDLATRNELLRPILISFLEDEYPLWKACVAIYVEMYLDNLSQSPSGSKFPVLDLEFGQEYPEVSTETIVPLWYIVLLSIYATSSRPIFGVVCLLAHIRRAPLNEIRSWTAGVAVHAEMLCNLVLRQRPARRPGLELKSSFITQSSSAAWPGDPQLEKSLGQHWRSAVCSTRAYIFVTGVADLVFKQAKLVLPYSACRMSLEEILRHLTEVKTPISVDIYEASMRYQQFLLLGLVLIKQRLEDQLSVSLQKEKEDLDESGQLREQIEKEEVIYTRVKRWHDA
jgi:hypothetical protein